MRGVYIENYDTPEAKDVGEDTFFVVDLDDKGNLKKTLMEFGEEYDQDSILFVPKGGTKGLLIGTNDAEFPSKGNENHLNNPVFGKGGEFQTRVNGRPFTLEESTINEVTQVENLQFSKMALQQAIKAPIDYSL